MKQRTNSYLKTFPNTPEGIESYKEFVKTLRTFVKGGKLSKKFRGGDRGNYTFVNYKGETIKVWSGSTRKKNSTRFDVYLHNTWGRNEKGEFQSIKPKFFNFELNCY